MFCNPAERKAKNLQEIELKVLSSDTCQNISDSFAVFEDEKIDFYEEGIFCAGGEKGKDSCTGDSGSAVFAKEADEVMELGLVSGQPGTEVCGREGYPTYYTRVSFYLKWIMDNLVE